MNSSPFCKSEQGTCKFDIPVVSVVSFPDHSPRSGMRLSLPMHSAVPSQLQSTGGQVVVAVTIMHTEQFHPLPIATTQAELASFPGTR